MKKMIFIAVVIIVLVIGYNVHLINEEVEDINKFTFSEIEISLLQSGTYSGSFSGKIVSAKVEVMIKNGVIEEIILLEHKYGKGENAENILPLIIEKQSLQVDTIAGATISSKVILKAVEEAIN